MKTKIRYVIGLAAMLACLSTQAQMNPAPLGAAPLPPTLATNVTVVSPPTSLADLPGTIQSYFLNNDPAFNGWLTNKFLIWQAAKFANVNGVAGASSLGNSVGLEIPIHKYNIHVDSSTDFEQLFGDVHAQAFGLGLDYAVHQIHLSGGLDAQYVFLSHHLQAMPYVELCKMPTTLYGLAPFLRYAYPISKAPGAGVFLIGVGLSF